jgi:hypothetical protein
LTLTGNGQYMLHANGTSVKHTVVYKLGYQGNHACPAGYEEQRQHHFWCHTAVKAEKDGPFRVVIEVARSSLMQVSD